jgi:hypothetical protein
VVDTPSVVRVTVIPMTIERTRVRRPVGRRELAASVMLESSVTVGDS